MKQKYLYHFVTNAFRITLPYFIITNNKRLIFCRKYYRNNFGFSMELNVFVGAPYNYPVNSNHDHAAEVTGQSFLVHTWCIGRGTTFYHQGDNDEMTLI